VLATVAKVLLIGFLVVAVGFIVVTYIRKSRGGRNPGFRSNGHLAQIEGAMPVTPLPEWANDPEWHDVPRADGEAGRCRGDARDARTRKVSGE
jgi:hypothetical protein